MQVFSLNAKHKPAGHDQSKQYETQYYDKLAFLFLRSSAGSKTEYLHDVMHATLSMLAQCYAWI